MLCQSAIHSNEPAWSEYMGNQSSCNIGKVNNAERILTTSLSSISKAIFLHQRVKNAINCKSGNLVSAYVLSDLSPKSVYDCSGLIHMLQIWGF